jgi:hypothetical protein
MIGLEKKGTCLRLARSPIRTSAARQRPDDPARRQRCGARRIANADPFVTGGLRTFEVRE